MIDNQRLLQEISKYPGKTDEEIVAILQAQAKLATVPAPEWSEIVQIFEAA